MDRDDIVAAMVRLAERGDVAAALRLHRWYTEGDSTLKAYAEPPKDKAGRVRSPAGRGRPHKKTTRYDKDGRAIPDPNNTWMDLDQFPFCVRVAIVMEQERRNGWVGDDLQEKVADRLSLDLFSIRKCQIHDLRVFARNIVDMWTRR